MTPWCHHLEELETFLRCWSLVTCCSECIGWCYDFYFDHHLVQDTPEEDDQLYLPIFLLVLPFCSRSLSSVISYLFEELPLVILHEWVCQLRSLLIFLHLRMPSSPPRNSQASNGFIHKCFRNMFLEEM